MYRAELKELPDGKFSICVYEGEKNASLVFWVDPKYAMQLISEVADARLVYEAQTEGK